MDLSSIIGWVAGIALVIFSIMLNKDPGTGGYQVTPEAIKSFFDPPSIAIVVGGTICALLVSYPLSMFKKIPKHFSMMFKDKNPEPIDSIDQIVEFAKEARINGVLALEEKVKEISDPFMKNALMMVCDSVDPEKVKEMMDSELDYLEERHSQCQNFYLKGSDYAPSFGMIGTLIGLINLLGNLSDSDALAGNMAVALITTLYGSLLSSLVFKPIANKLKVRHEAEMLNKTIISVGVQGIVSGDNPNLIQEKLMKLLPNSGEGGKKEGKKGKEKPANG
ncbi:MAG: motility protein A [Oscillospiraceae bacterium]